MSVAEFVYTTILKPRPLKRATNWAIQRLIPHQIDQHGAVVILNPDDPVISGALALGVYEKPETRFFLSVCWPGLTFVDVGANVGYYTALASRRIGSSGCILAFEPDPQSFVYLKKNIRANGGSAVAIPKAVADRNAAMQLFVSASNRGDNRLYDNDLATDSVLIEAVRLDDELRTRGVHTVDLIKMDVQGFERRALDGMEGTLRRSPNIILLTEFWPDGLRRAGDSALDMLRFLSALSFRIYHLTASGALKKIADYEGLISAFPGRKYTNIVAVKGKSLPGQLEENA